jgi:iron complex outermembrane receptor protein
MKFTFNQSFKSNLNAGYMLRAPEVNELYSFGLHQGVSGIEEGNRDLATEKSFKIILTNDWSYHEKLFLQAIVYFQKINDYIYLEPQNEFILTIRGAFPFFIYQQTDANVYGGDLLLTFEPRKDLKFIVKYAIVRGDDVTNNIGLINIPADNVFTSIQYSLPNFNPLKNNFVSLNGAYTFKQNRVLPEQDFLLPPDAYFLLGFGAGTSLQFQHSNLKFILKIENILNEKYRDYLNRLRYFADDMGININLGINYTF